MKKRNLFTALFCLCFFCSTLPAYATTITGQAVSTDIVAYINDLPIPSYNINGKTAIVAEDLAQYGFSVSYSNAKRLLSIEYPQPNHQNITATYKPQKNTKPIGSFVAHVYATNIVTTIAEEPVPSYNIGGKTLIFMDALKAYGDVIWNAQTRTSKFYVVPNWHISIPEDTTADTTAPISDFTITYKQNASGTFDITGNNNQYLSSVVLSGGTEPIVFSFSIDMDVMNQTDALMKLLDQMYNTNRGEWVKDEVDFSNAHMKITINGEPVTITHVNGSGGNGHTDYIFTLNKTIKHIKEIQSVTISCQ